MSRALQSPWHDRLRATLARVVTVEPAERAGLAWSFVYFFCVLAAYYIVRPVRDEMGVVAGKDGLERIFIYVFLVMLAAVPVFSKIVASVSRRLVVPVIYVFFIANLIAFRVALGFGESKLLAQSFFVWASVFNLFTISLFWIVMSEHWGSEQAKRLYGFIAAGGSIGGIVGPFIAQSLVQVIGPDNLLLVSAVFLGLALMAAMQVRAAFSGLKSQTVAERAPSPERDSLFKGAEQVWRSPYLFQIALAILVANVVSTFFYLEQAGIVGGAITDRAERVQLFARMDLTVSVLTIAMQVLLTRVVMQRMGVGIAAGLLPVAALLGFVALAVKPVLWVIVTVVVIERAITFSIASPAMRVLYTLVEPDEKYRAQNFIDTVVYRGGDAISGSLFSVMTKTFAMASAGVAVVSIPLALLWLAICLGLGKRHAERAAEMDRETLSHKVAHG